MKASLNASVRDAQIRDSFNKESFIINADTAILTTVEFLYKAQCDLPRNASKLHSLVVIDPKSAKSYLVNFEVLRGLPMIGDDVVMAFKDLKDSTQSKLKKKGEIENDN